MSASSTRRDFMKHAALAGAVAPLIITSTKAAPAAAAPAGKEKLRLAFIGVGGIGGMHIDEFTKFNIEVPCFAEVDTSRDEGARKRWPNAKGFQDYRQMFDKMEKEFDAVIVGVPDHHHYPATALALKAKKHAYTQKPLTHTVWESRQLAKLAKEAGVATQMGNQGHGQQGWRIAIEHIWNGNIGQVKEVHTWTNRPIWPQGVDRPRSINDLDAEIDKEKDEKKRAEKMKEWDKERARITEETSIPASLNWDAWISPAPMRPYHKGVYHPFAWRGWWDFGCGAIGDMAAHTMDGVFWALEAFDPISVDVTAMTPMGRNDETYPKASIIKHEFGPRGKRDYGFVHYWYEGGLRPSRPPELEDNRQLPETGNLFIGTKGVLMVGGDYGNSPQIIPESRRKELGNPPKMLERSPGNYSEWFQASTGQKPIDFCKSNFSYAGPMCESMLFGCVAQRAGRKLMWDAANLRVTNFEEANKWINKEYRDGWRF